MAWHLAGRASRAVWGQAPHRRAPFVVPTLLDADSLRRAISSFSRRHTSPDGSAREFFAARKTAIARLRQPFLSSGGGWPTADRHPRCSLHSQPPAHGHVSSEAADRRVRVALPNPLPRSATHLARISAPVAPMIAQCSHGECWLAAWRWVGPCLSELPARPGAAARRNAAHGRDGPKAMAQLGDGGQTIMMH